MTFSGSAQQRIRSDNTAGKTFEFNNLTVNNPSANGVQIEVTAAGAATLDIEGNFSVPSGQVMNMTDQAGGQYVRVELEGNLSWGGNVTEADSLVVFEGTGNQSIESAATLNFMEINRPSQGAGTSVTFDTAGNDLTVFGNFTIGPECGAPNGTGRATVGFTATGANLYPGFRSRQLPYRLPGRHRRRAPHPAGEPALRRRKQRRLLRP